MYTHTHIHISIHICVNVKGKKSERQWIVMRVEVGYKKGFSVFPLYPAPKGRSNDCG